MCKCHSFYYSFVITLTNHSQKIYLERKIEISGISGIWLVNTRRSEHSEGLFYQLPVYEPGISASLLIRGSICLYKPKFD